MPYQTDHTETCWKTPYAPPQPSGNGGSTGDLRERIKALEVRSQMSEQAIHQRLDAQVGRMNGIDGRLAAGDKRMSGHQDRLTRQDSAITQVQKDMVPLTALGARVSAIETMKDQAAQYAKYALGAILLFLTLTGRMTIAEIEQVWKLFTHQP